MKPVNGKSPSPSPSPSPRSRPINENRAKIKLLDDEKASGTDELKELKALFAAEQYNLFISSAAPKTMGGEYRLNKFVDHQKVEAKNIYPVSCADFSIEETNDTEKKDQKTNEMLQRVSNKLEGTGKYLYFSEFDEASSSEPTSGKIRHRLQFISNELKSTVLGEDKIKDMSDKERCTVDDFYSILKYRDLEASILSTAERPERVVSKSDAPSQGPSESPPFSEHPQPPPPPPAPALPPPPPPPLPPSLAVSPVSEGATKKTISSKSTEMSDLSQLDENSWFNPKKALKEDGASASVDADVSKHFECQKTYLKERYTNFYKKMNDFKKALDETKKEGEKILDEIFKSKKKEYEKAKNEIASYKLKVESLNKEIDDEVKKELENSGVPISNRIFLKDIIKKQLKEKIRENQKIDLDKECGISLPPMPTLESVKAEYIISKKRETGFMPFMNHALAQLVSIKKDEGIDENLGSNEDVLQEYVFKSNLNESEISSLVERCNEDFIRRAEVVGAILDCFVSLKMKGLKENLKTDESSFISSVSLVCQDKDKMKNSSFIDEVLKMEGKLSKVPDTALIPLCKKAYGLSGKEGISFPSLKQKLITTSSPELSIKDAAFTFIPFEFESKKLAEAKIFDLKARLDIANKGSNNEAVKYFSGQLEQAYKDAAAFGIEEPTQVDTRKSSRLSFGIHKPTLDSGAISKNSSPSQSSLSKGSIKFDKGSSEIEEKLTEILTQKPKEDRRRKRPEKNESNRSFLFERGTSTQRSIKIKPFGVKESVLPEDQKELEKKE